MTVHFPIVFMFSTHGVQPALPGHGREILRHHGLSLPGGGGLFQRGRDHDGLLHLVAELHGQAAEAGQGQDPPDPRHAAHLDRPFRLAAGAYRTSWIP
ncbi:MAG: hypothetical protein MZV70_71715 [Desulfobacterales bacterium]|nr:hypothetical protein [Desulfobacterales bacterium]